MPYVVSSYVQESTYPSTDKDTHASALRAIAQAAVNVELFTVPLYMAALYSIQGMHQITGRCEDFYKGRLWPGPATTAKPPNEQSKNERAFNLIFSVFIEEMLHIQMAANLASAIGVTPCFTSKALQDEHHGWTCYGPKPNETMTVIPCIVDLKDTTPETFENVEVNIAALSINQVELFMAIEQPEDDAKKSIKPGKLGKYFPEVPFDDETVNKIREGKPVFGTIGHMYQCYWNYMNLRYDDNTTLWEYVFQPGSQQNDLFNVKSSGHPEREYLGFETTLAAKDPAKARAQALAMMNAITDQGEGSELKERVAALADLDLMAVKDTYQASRCALEFDYPRYTDTGWLAGSADAVARYDNGARDHYERFTELIEFLPEVVTWPAWHEQREQEHPGKGHWKAEDLQTQTYKPEDNRYGLPSTQAIAEAMNRMAGPGCKEAYHRLISQAAVGALAGITTVLNDYWRKPGQDEQKVSFPYPSMVGSGDRMAICWALFGEAPDLSCGIGKHDPKTLYHACQALDLQTPGNNCAQVAIFHTCRGSNKCKAEGGCGFVQKTTTDGVLCGSAVVAAKASCGGGGGDGDDVFSAPSDNKCASYGGCAVPISASQVFPQGGTMALYDFADNDHRPQRFGEMLFNKGDKVYDVAYRAYREVIKHRNDLSAHGDPPMPVVPPPPPKPNDLRLAFPPST